MKSFYGLEFGPFGERIWFNCAHQGPLPRIAVQAAEEVLRQKVTPHLIEDDDFVAVPNRLKVSLARLIGASPEEIILGNSASYGLHVLRNGIAWQTGDEILVAEGDFPATVYPWLGLQQRGVRVRFLKPSGNVLRADEIAQALTPATRLLALSWVNSFNGSILDLSGIAQICRKNRVVWVVNGSQGIGALPIDVQNADADAIVCCGYKWLCGPYGTGFCWIKPHLRKQLIPAQDYWLPNVWGRENLQDYNMKAELGSAAFDVFCTANFLNYVPWNASLELLLQVGVSAIEEHNLALVEHLVSGIKKSKYRVISPADAARISAIVVISHHQASKNREIHCLLKKAGIDIAFRNGNLRFSLHLYNTAEEVERAISVLNGVE